MPRALCQSIGIDGSRRFTHLSFMDFRQTPCSLSLTVPLLLDVVIKPWLKPTKRPNMLIPKPIVKCLFEMGSGDFVSGTLHF